MKNKFKFKNYMVFFSVLGILLLAVIVNFIQQRTELRGRAQTASIQPQCSPQGTVQFAISFTNPESFAIDLLADVLLQTQTLSRNYLSIPAGHTQTDVISTNLTSLPQAGDVVYSWSPSGTFSEQNETTASFGSITCKAEAAAGNTSTTSPPQTLVLAKDLEIPWAMSFLPNGDMLFTERPGRVRLLTKDGLLVQNPIATISEVKAVGEGGLLGIAVHPKFTTNKFIYVYYTYAADNNDNTKNRVVRYTAESSTLSNRTVVVDNIPGAVNHNGGRIKFGPDGYLYISTGDALEPSLAQNKNALAGKILRVTDDGKPAPGNPFNNLIYSYGHRNPQGLAWDKNTLYATEHGQSAHDELNRIEPGSNYGWPTIDGERTQAGMMSPILQSDDETWAPSGTAFYNGFIFFGGLRGESLYQIDPKSPKNSIIHFEEKYGRIREVVVGPDNKLYIATSNRDGRGNPFNQDDKIIRVDMGWNLPPLSSPENAESILNLQPNTESPKVEYEAWYETLFNDFVAKIQMLLFNLQKFFGAFSTQPVPPGTM